MFLSKLHEITTFVFDVDGVLTDGSVFVTDSGDKFRQFNIKDGYALQLAVKCGYKVAAISGAVAESTRIRLNDLGVKDVFMASKDKVATLKNYLEHMGIDASTAVFMGDDIPDMKVMQYCGLPVCPADAVEEIKAISTYISPIPGGKGCARDIIEKVMKVQGKWLNAEAYSW
ncbi:KdsC family phosphatase [Mucilaginibacter myungsuensis]|uniref:HAD-IIIA family hydrolase n=1 Tax=Mucilaginibacter myungsuensis TaxID=649104 RepID=A0A929PUM3_9SPHI|nr:HAD-IIIA family hydrolase [Mucilaginibacter myungsuensis]MBE9660918.1 HAD-IIIA family hydrolase [Mucilaginibacter myungsuensis]MDN3600964.1 HAD-IIIA family hydrolase [Mucilaginibacter myungsuensis]